MITWDETKRQLNIRVHGLDFVGCEAVFDGPMVAWDDGPGSLWRVEDQFAGVS